jgi:hypothetical protein
VDDLERFNQLIALDKRGVLTDDEAAHIHKVHWAARWGAFTQAFSFIGAALGARMAERFGRKSNVPKWRYFSTEERARIDEILAAHETHDRP